MAFFKYFLFVLQPGMPNYEIREFANSTIQRTKQAIYEIPILIIPRETIFFVDVYVIFVNRNMQKISIILYICIPFFHHVHCGVYFFISFFPSLPPIQFVMNVSLHDDVIHRFTCPPLYDVHSLRESLFVIFAKVKFKLFPCVDPLINIFWEPIEFSFRFFVLYS